MYFRRHSPYLEWQTLSRPCSIFLLCLGYIYLLERQAWEQIKWKWIPEAEHAGGSCWTLWFEAVKWFLGSCAPLEADVLSFCTFGLKLDDKTWTECGLIQISVPTVTFRPCSIMIMIIMMWCVDVFGMRNLSCWNLFGVECLSFIVILGPKDFCSLVESNSLIDVQHEIGGLIIN